MEFLWRAAPASSTLALFPGAWNPPTRAHLAMAEAALAFAPELVFVLARHMPHKLFDGPSFDQRAAWLRALCAPRPAFSAAATAGGLFLDIAREARAATGASRILLVCGRDAAERLLSWDYGSAHPPIHQQLQEFELLVAPRNGPFTPPPALASRVHALPLPPEWDHVSSSRVRAHRAQGRDCAHLLPAEIQDF